MVAGMDAPLSCPSRPLAIPRASWWVPADYPLKHAYRVSGTLKAWQGMARLAVGNSRLVFLLSTAFAGPLLQLVGVEGGGVHLVGSSTVGKTTGLKVAGSVWGGGGLNGYIRTWRATDNALEGTAVALRHASVPR